MSRYRSRMSKGRSRRVFRRTSGVHPKNVTRGPIMRGGIRL